MSSGSEDEVPDIKEEAQEMSKDKSLKEKQPKKEKAAKVPDANVQKLTDDNGNALFDIGRNRRVSLSNFKGKQMINIREYYLEKKSNTLKPGAKGITLYEEEWKNLLSLAEEFKFD